MSLTVAVITNAVLVVALLVLLVAVVRIPFRLDGATVAAEPLEAVADERFAA